MQIEKMKSVVSKEAVIAAIKDAIAERDVTSQGNKHMNATDCYGLLLVDVVEELVETLSADDETTVEEPRDRKLVFMRVWEFYPKNPSAFRQTFFEGKTGAEVMVDKYSAI